MPRSVAVGLALVALLTSVAHGQVFDSKVTFSGFVDTVTTAGTNVFDADFARREEAWTARNRFRLRLTADTQPWQILSVLELEVDYVWGSLGTEFDKPERGFGLRDELTTSGDIFKVKNAYVEFPVPAPAPMPYTKARLGAQPFHTTLKRSVLATSDYAGISLDSQICGVNRLLCDDARVAFTYAQLEESLTGKEAAPVDRGDDFFTFLSLTYPVPVDRLGVRFIPRLFWGYLDAVGVAASPARCQINCAGLPLNGTDPPGPRGLVPTTGNFRPSSNESRHYVGLDGEIEIPFKRWGTLNVQPTVIYMTSKADVYGRPGEVATAFCDSDRDLRCPTGPHQTMRAQSWLVDLRAWWLCDGQCLDETWLGNYVRLGDAIEIGGLFMWTPGDASHHNLFRRNHVYHPITTDGDYLNGWNEILATGSVDNLTGNAHGMGDNVGLGQYGRLQIGTRVTWDLYRNWDRGLSFHFKSSWVWTDKKVDTDAGSPLGGRTTGSYGNVPCAISETDCLPGNNRRGDARYVGTEISVGMTYKLHRHLVFDIVGAWLFSGGALDSTSRNLDGTLIKHDAKDARLMSARVKYSF